jgi:hypothetical protein
MGDPEGLFVLGREYMRNGSKAPFWIWSRDEVSHHHQKKDSRHIPLPETSTNNKHKTQRSKKEDIRKQKGDIRREGRTEG